MGSTLASPAVQDVLRDLRAIGAAEDEAANKWVRESERELGARLYG